MRPNPQETADLVTLTEEILNGKFRFFPVCISRCKLLALEIIWIIYWGFQISLKLSAPFNVYAKAFQAPDVTPFPNQFM